MSPALAELESVAQKLETPIEAIRQFLDLLFDLDVSDLTDDNFIILEHGIDNAVRLLAADEPAVH